MDEDSNEIPVVFEKEDLITIANMKMPFGKYKGVALIHLPEPYLLWFAKRRVPSW